jgi:hypothetical protein
MNIHQVNVSYVNEQDRFLLRINSSSGEEFRAWLTRRLTLGLLPLLGKKAAEQLKAQIQPPDPATPLSHQRHQLVENFEKEAAAYKGDFQTPFKEGSAALPLGPEPLLVTEMKITSLADGKLQIEMLEKLAGRTRDLQMVMDPPLTQGLLRLLAQGLKTSRWMETPPALAALDASGQAGSPPAQEGADAEANTPADKPRYLN